MKTAGGQGSFAARLAGPAIGAFAVRAAVLAVALARTGTAAIASGDTASYLIPGRSLLLHGRFATGVLPEIDRTPGYALFLAVTSLPGMAFAALVQVVLSAASVILVARLARTAVGDEGAAILAAWIYAFEPLAVVYSARLLPETLFAALLLMSLERVAAFLRGRRLGALVAGGFWLAAAIFVRPVGYYLPFALAGGLIVALRRERGLRWKAPAVLLAAVLPWLVVWQARNWMETGFGGFSSIAARNLYFYQAAEVEARAERRPLSEVQKELGYADEQSYLARHPEQAEWSEGRRAAFMGKAASAILGAHPGLALQMYAEGVAVVALTPGGAELLGLTGTWPHDWPARIVDRGPVRSSAGLAARHPGTACVLVLFAGVLVGLYLLAVRGGVGLGAKSAQMWLLAGAAAYLIGIAGGAQAVGRYRLPAMPEICILAAVGTRGRRRSGMSEAQTREPEHEAPALTQAPSKGLELKRTLEKDAAG